MLTYFITAVLIVFLLFAVVSFFFSDLAIHPRKTARNAVYKKEIEAGGFDGTWYKNLEKIDVRIKSPYGYTLQGVYIPFDHSDKTIILCHGFKSTMFGCMKYAPMFLKMGFNVLVYDSRYHGESGGKNLTFGFYEKYDLRACIDWVIEHCGVDTLVGVFGESMGASIALLNATIESRVMFYIVDSAFSDLTALLKYRFEYDFKLPFILFGSMTNFWFEMRTGMSMDLVSPIEDIHKVETPMLFIHGNEDRYVPKEMTIGLYNKKIGAKQLFLAPNAGHVNAYNSNRYEYEQQVTTFLRRFVLIE